MEKSKPTTYTHIVSNPEDDILHAFGSTPTVWKKLDPVPRFK
jgi:hypothetical protein